MTGPGSMDAAVVNVTELVAGARLRPFHVLVVALCALLIFFDGFDLQAVSYAAPAISRELVLTRPQLGPVFSAGLLGLMGGALLFGWLGDRFGRKRVFITCGLIFGLASVATASAGSLGTLLAWRVAAGLALGGATPLAITIATDTAPQRIRATLTMIMYTGFTLGGVFGGYVYARLPTDRWDLLFIIGGALPILFAPVLMALLPESPDWLVLAGAPAERVAAVLRRHAPERSFAGARFVTSSPRTTRFEVASLFAPGLAATTCLLWGVFFSSLVTLFFFTTWLPTLLTGSGHSPDQVVAVNLAVQGSGLLGSLLLARLIINVRPFLAIGCGYLLAGAAILLFSRTGEASFPVVVAAAFAVGFVLVGSQNGLNAMSAQLYPASLRSTGVGWGIGVGRIGGVIGPSLAGLLLALQWSTPELMAVASIPSFAAGLIAFAIAGVARRTPAMAAAE